MHDTDSADNYTEPIHGGLELESNPPYLMYTHGNDEVSLVCVPFHSFTYNQCQSETRRSTNPCYCIASRGVCIHTYVVALRSWKCILIKCAMPSVTSAVRVV